MLCRRCSLDHQLSGNASFDESEGRGPRAADFEIRIPRVAEIQMGAAGSAH